MTRGARRRSLPAISQHPPLRCVGVTRQNLAVLGTERRRGPAAIPLLEYQSICPPRGSPFKQSKAIFSPAPAFFKGTADAWGIHYHRIASPSAGATPGRAFSLIRRSTPGGKLLPCNTNNKPVRRRKLRVIKIHFLAPAFSLSSRGEELR